MPDKDYQDIQEVRELYHGRGYAIAKVAKILDCPYNTLRRWMDQVGIQKRDPGKKGSREGVHISLSSGNGEILHVPGCPPMNYSRAIMIGEKGLDAVKDKVVHHDNELKWDDRPSNLELHSREDHSALHRKREALDSI